MKLSDFKSVTPFMLFCCLTFNIGNVLFGLDVGSFGSLQALPSFLRTFGELDSTGQYNLSTSRKSIMNSVNWTGKLLGCALFEYVIERVGFKKTMYILAVVQIIGVVLEISAGHWVQFTVGRVVTYAAVGLVEPLVPTYQAELSPSALRGFFAGNVQVLVHVGAIWGAGMSRAYATELSANGWRIPVAMQFIPPVMLLVLTPFCIEPPRWLISKDRKEEAIKVLSRIRSPNHHSAEMIATEAEGFSQAIEESKLMNNGSWKDMFGRTYIRRTIIVALLFWFQQSTGQQFANSYGPSFFRSIGLSGDRLFTSSTLIPLAGLIGCLIAVFTSDIVGRRTLCIIGALLAVLFTALTASYGSKSDVTTNDAESNVVVVSVILLNGVCKLGVASQCWIIASEIGGAQMRKKLMTWGVVLDVFAAFIVTFFTPYLQAGPQVQLGARVGYVFMGLAILSFFFYFFFTPELRGRSLEEVDELFERDLWAWQFSKAKTTGVGSQIAALEAGQIKGAELNVSHHEVGHQAAVAK